MRKERKIEMLRNDTNVKIINTGSDTLDGLIGKITGIVAQFTDDHIQYIVSFDKPLLNGYTSISITSYCLEFVGIEHDWECVSPGLYDSLHRCKKCKIEHIEQADNLKETRLPDLGCK